MKKLFYLQKIQLFLILVFFFVSCSNKKDEVILPFNSPEYKWFDSESKYSSYDKSSVHLFYDFKPDVDFSSYEINFIPIRLQENNISYHLDLLSGKRYKSHFNCPKTKDVWKEFDETIDIPNFTLGYIPRTFDQMGDLQKVYVFGDDEIYRKKMNASYRVRVVGGLHEQSCFTQPCTDPKNWNSIISLVAVNIYDSDYSKITGYKSLSDLEDLDYFKAFVQNSFGTNYLNGKLSPALKVEGIVSPKMAMKMMYGYGLYFDDDRLNKLKKSCHALYDENRENFKSFSNLFLKSNVQDIKNLNERNLKDYLERQKFNEKEFVIKFKSFFKKYAKNLYYCSRLVKYSSINKNKKEYFWFSKYMVGLLNALDINLLYHCEKDAWFKSDKDDIKSMIDKQVLLLENCGARSLEKMFPLAINEFKKYKSLRKQYYRFIDYDSNPGGTHKKIYNWVYQDDSKITCRDKKVENLNKRESVFPSDIRWYYQFDRDVGKNLKVIF